MNWRDLGIVWSPETSNTWSRSHAMAPTPILMSKDVIRVYYTSLDEQGRGRPLYVDVSSENPREILNVGATPIMDIGEPGTFDDNGVLVTSLVKLDEKKLYMYYAGFELGEKIRYRIFTGLAISEDGGDTFERFSKVPILDRSNSELYFRGGPFVLRHDQKFKLWYVAGDKWVNIKGKELPRYEIKYLESQNGIEWGSEGRLSLPILNADEHGFGRPWVRISKDGNFHFYYSIRRISFGAYRLGYGRSRDGVSWERQDSKMNLDVKPNSHASKAIMYSAVIDSGENTFCFYNGDNFGEKGFAVAILES